MSDNKPKPAIKFLDKKVTPPPKAPKNEYTSTGEVIIFSNYVKIERLSGIVYDCFSNTSIASATQLNVFVDLYPVIHPMFSASARVHIKDPLQLVPAIINMCAHYRSFFKTLGVRTAFYLVYSSNTCDINRKFYGNYNVGFEKKTKILLYQKLLGSVFDLLTVLCPYLPDIYFIKSVRNYESSVIIADIIEKLNSNVPNMIITKDLYPIQLCTLYPYTTILCPHKTKTADKSIMIPISEKSTFRERFWSLVALKRDMSINNLITISPINFSLYSALTRFPEREMEPETNSNKAIDIIRSLVGSEDIRVFPSQFYNGTIENMIPVSTIEGRYNALDVSYMLPKYKADIESKEMKFENLSDNSTINLINSKYFSTNPIDVMRL